MLEPAAAEVLTCKFDEMEPLLTKEQQYDKLFYISIFSNQILVVNSICLLYWGVLP